MDLSNEHFRAYVFLELQRGRRSSEIYQQLLDTHVDGLRRYVTEDESRIFFDSIQPKESNKVWLCPGQPRPQVCRQQLTTAKTMLLVAFTCDKKFNVAVTQKNLTVDADRFVHSTGERWRRLTRDPVKLTDLWWQHDNARPHSSQTMKEFFNQCSVTMIWQPPYSPDMNLADRFLFKLLKKELR